jgi:hypothetical protein
MSAAVPPGQKVYEFNYPTALQGELFTHIVNSVNLYIGGIEGEGCGPGSAAKGVFIPLTITTGIGQANITSYSDPKREDNTITTITFPNVCSTVALDRALTNLPVGPLKTHGVVSTYITSRGGARRRRTRSRKHRRRSTRRRR